MYSREEVRVKRWFTNTTFTHKTSFFHEAKCHLSFPEPDDRLSVPKSKAKLQYLRCRDMHKKGFFLRHANKQLFFLTLSLCYLLNHLAKISGASSHLDVPGFFVPTLWEPRGCNTWLKSGWNPWLKATCYWAKICSSFSKCAHSKTEQLDLVMWKIDFLQVSSKGKLRNEESHGPGLACFLGNWALQRCAYSKEDVMQPRELHQQMNQSGRISTETVTCGLIWSCAQSYQPTARFMPRTNKLVFLYTVTPGSHLKIDVLSWDQHKISQYLLASETKFIFVHWQEALTLDQWLKACTHAYQKCLKILITGWGLFKTTAKWQHLKDKMVHFISSYFWCIFN